MPGLRQTVGGLADLMGWLPMGPDWPAARPFRGLLAGKPEELFSVVPFSDAMGLTRPEDRTTARDLVEQYGGPGSSLGPWGRLASTAVGAATDPLNWVAPGKALAWAPFRYPEIGELLGWK
jgi:hypothetical protein